MNKNISYHIIAGLIDLSKLFVIITALIVRHEDTNWFKSSDVKTFISICLVIYVVNLIIDLSIYSSIVFLKYLGKDPIMFVSDPVFNFVGGIIIYVCYGILSIQTPDELVSEFFYYSVLYVSTIIMMMSSIFTISKLMYTFYNEHQIVAYNA